MEDRLFLNLVDNCYRTIDDPAGWQDIMAALMRHLDSDAGDITIEDYENGVARAIGTRGFDDCYRVNYDEDFLGANGWIEKLKVFPRGRSMCNDAEPEDFDRSAYYNEWVRPQGFRHAVGSILEDSAVRLVHIGFLRNERRRPFAYDDARSLDRVLPHIHRAIRSGERLRTAISASGTVFALVDSLRLPALLVDESKRVLHANYATETFIRSSAELSLSGGRIAATDHRANKTLQAALDAACSIDSMVRLAVRTEVIVPKDAGLPIVVELLPLRSEYRAGFGEPRCLVIANDPDLALPKKLLLLREAYGLTPVEARLAWVLANGESLADYAEHNAIAVSTARWHLKNIQAKTGARTLEAVIGLVHASILRF